MKSVKVFFLVLSLMFTNQRVQACEPVTGQIVGIVLGVMFVTGGLTAIPAILKIPPMEANRTSAESNVTIAQAYVDSSYEIFGASFSDYSEHSSQVDGIICTLDGHENFDLGVENLLVESSKGGDAKDILQSTFNLAFSQDREVSYDDSVSGSSIDVYKNCMQGTFVNSLDCGPYTREFKVIAEPTLISESSDDGVHINSYGTNIKIVYELDGTEVKSDFLIDQDSSQEIASSELLKSIQGHLEQANKTFFESNTDYEAKLITEEEEVQRAKVLVSQANATLQVELEDLASKEEILNEIDSNLNHEKWVWYSIPVACSAGAGLAVAIPLCICLKNAIDARDAAQRAHQQRVENYRGVINGLNQWSRAINGRNLF